jgi:hypothetical protein
MPNLINNPGNVSNALAQNYRRTRVGSSTFGTRTIQLYEIHIYGLSDTVYENFFSNGRGIIEGTVVPGMDPNLPWGIDQPLAYELADGNIAEAILRGVQEMGEIYIVGAPDFYTDPGYNELVITVGLSADTINSGWEQEIGNAVFNPNATWLEGVIGDSVEQWAIDHEEYWDGLDVYPVYLYGDSTSEPIGPFALAKTDPTVQALRAAKQAKNAALKQARASAGRTGYTAKTKRPG